MPISLHVYHDQRQVFSTQLDAAIEIGRQQNDEPAPYCRLPTAEGTRIVVANLTEASLSRRHVRMEPRDDGTVHVCNLSKAVAVATDTDIISPSDFRDQIPGR